MMKHKISRISAVLFDTEPVVLCSNELKDAKAELSHKEDNPELNLKVNQLVIFNIIWI